MRMLAVLALMVPTLTAGNTMPDLGDIIRIINPKLQEKQISLYVKAISTAATKYSVDYKIVAAVIAQESRFNPKAVGSLGELGLMQLRPEYFGEESIHPVLNIIRGTKYLATLRWGFYPRYRDFRWLEHYNQGPGKTPRKFPYTKKVLSYYHQFGGTL